MDSDQISIEPFLPQIDPDRLLPLVKMGMITEMEMEQIRASRKEFLTSPDPYLLTLSLMVCGEKVQ